MPEHHHPKAVADLDAEESLVRAAIEHPEIVDKVLRVVTAKDFGDHVCSKIWAAVETLARSRNTIGFDEVVRALSPEDVLGPDGCSDAKSVADCVREILGASGTSQEAMWCALRIRTQSLRNALLNQLMPTERALIAHQSKEVKDLLRESCKLATEYRRAHLRDSRELRRLQQAGRN